MATAWSAEQVLAMAPDAGSASSGKGLASTRKWASLGAAEGVVWGECQGSGSKPYQTKVELTAPAFHCSCPSRKFPCKHGLGLLLLWADQAGAFAAGEPPEWVASWLEGRSRRAEQKAVREQEKQEKIARGEAVVDPEAKRKAQEKRDRKVAAGLDELGLWLHDLARDGLAAVQGKGYGYWDERARRLVDAQAPGAARQVAELAELSFTRDGWHEVLLERLGRLHLLAESFRRIDALPAETLADVRATLGYNVPQDEVRAGPGVRDTWQVIGQRVEQEDRLRVQRTWLLGRESGRPALILDFAHGAQPHDATMPPGMAFEGELAFFPGAVPLRALVKQRQGAPVGIADLTGHPSLDSAHDAYAGALRGNPWLARYPLVLDGVTLVRHGEGWRIRDRDGATLPVSPRFVRGWHVLAICGGAPLTLCGEYDGEVFEPLSGVFEGAFRLIAPGEAEGATGLPPTVAGPADLVSTWQGATASALVGVARKPPAIPAGRDALGRTLKGLESREPPARLLGLAAALPLYARAGRKPAIDPTDPPAVCPPDERPECPEPAAARLQCILGGTRSEVLDEWLQLLDGSGCRLPAGSLVELLQLARRNLDLRRRLDPVLGARGRWLASRNEEWSFVAESVDRSDAESIWQTGTQRERLAALHALREADPHRARELIESTWSSENAETRVEHARALEPGLSMADEPFLESALDDRSKLVRQVVCDLLARLPESRFSTRMAERARGVLSRAGKARSKLAVEPPSACDAAMVRDGVEPKPPRGTGERSWWLRQVVAFTPLASWVERHEFTAGDLIRAAHATSWGKELWSGWAEAAARLRDEGWALALLADPPKADGIVGMHAENLIATLTPHRRDAFLTERLETETGPLSSKHPAFSLLLSVDPPLSEDLSRTILRRLALAFASHEGGGRRGRYDYALWQFAERLGRLIPTSLADEAEAILGDAARSEKFLSEAIRDQLETLRFRADMHKEFSR